MDFIKYRAATMTIVLASQEVAPAIPSRRVAQASMSNRSNCRRCLAATILDEPTLYINSSVEFRRGYPVYIHYC